MSKEYYTWVDCKFGKILYRGYKVVDGNRRRVHGKIDFKPTIYLESQDQESIHTSMYGQKLRPKTFESIAEHREFNKQYGSMMSTFGYAPNRVQYEFIAKAFQDKITYLLNDIEAVGLDIETRVGVNGPAGVPDPFTAVEEITHIALENHRTGATVSLSTVQVSFDQKDGAKYLHYDSEEKMLCAFVEYIVNEDPDIIYGFYADHFDYPYIINRIKNVLGQEWVNKLSPFGRVEEREYEEAGQKAVEINILGRTLLDIQTLYKKIVLKKEEGYSLDHLCKINLGVGKLVNPVATFKEFSESVVLQDKFAEYNVIDTQRMTQLDKKMGLLSLTVTLAYLMKCNYIDTKSPVKYWECYIMSTLANENRFVPIKESRNSRSSIPGAYVEEPVPGFYEWVISIDATALYPSIMKALNLSPETFVGMVDGVNVEGQLSGKTLSDYGVSSNQTLASNGATFRTDVVGIVPRLVDDVLDGRKIAKKEMLTQKQICTDIEAEAARRGIKL